MNEPKSIQDIYHESRKGLKKEEKVMIIPKNLVKVTRGKDTFVTSTEQEIIVIPE